MSDMKKNQAGLALGTLFGACHTLWVVAVGLGFEGIFLDWLHSIHFVTSPYTVTGFNLVTGLVGIVGAFVAGYVIGWVFAWIWNWLGKQ